jgi:hypothetical protein
MLYVIQAATILMFGAMMWMAFFRLRADRVTTRRKLTRGKHAFRPRDRMRFLLNRSFKLPEDRPEWEDPLVSRLAARPEPGTE